MQTLGRFTIWTRVYLLMWMGGDGVSFGSDWSIVLVAISLD